LRSGGSIARGSITQGSIAQVLHHNIIAAAVHSAEV
jgi:hypothetical protein